MDGAKAHSMEKRVRIGGRSNNTLATDPNIPMAANSHHIAVIVDIPTIILLPFFFFNMFIQFLYSMHIIYNMV